MRLSLAVASAVVAGAALAAIAETVLILVFHPGRAGGSPIDVTKLAFTVVGGVGGVVALVIAYRRQRDLEQGRFVERFGAAAAQLGATDVAVRIAGVYAMAGVADESEGLRRQQCIDVLCGYLRLPVPPEAGVGHLTKEIVKHPAAEDYPEREQHLEYRQNDSEVRKTIVRVLAAHLRRGTAYRWSDNDFDLSGARLEDADFRGAEFFGEVSFRRATFSGDTSFENAVFAADVSFQRARFEAEASFRGANFLSSVSFETAVFSGYASFEGATMRADASFRRSEFGGAAWFQGATFTGPAGFQAAVFCANTSFEGAAFSARVSFRSAVFADNAWFQGACFPGGLSFRNAAFRARAAFQDAAFEAETSFEGVDFGSAVVSFASPRRWGPPSPLFDWGSDAAGKPGNIEPLEWPPTAPVGVR
ncbi:pentapeptide repeat-containing protein [Nocardia veterana]|uniref:Pentapeptide repeat-containing protein n=1 Tax=Nocardia veterana TaxID=132249 RepID=A0A7X6RH66_9NOCA|nr:pentapeptide repeat-containing protein [Nocardia veterana]NKY85852.1 pentapeptide repeat-containing protein [Nocardia veterana]